MAEHVDVMAGGDAILRFPIGSPQRASEAAFTVDRKGNLTAVVSGVVMRAIVTEYLAAPDAWIREDGAGKRTVVDGEPEPFGAASTRPSTAVAAPSEHEAARAEYIENLSAKPPKRRRLAMRKLASRGGKVRRSSAEADALRAQIVSIVMSKGPCSREVVRRALKLPPRENDAVKQHLAHLREIGRLRVSGARGLTVWSLAPASIPAPTGAGGRAMQASA